MVTVQGIASVLDRTLFVNKGPMVKAPLPLLTGTDLRVSSWVEVTIQSGNFGTPDVGRLLQVSGSPGGVNDGEFLIKEVRTSKRLVLEGASFDITDVAATTALVVALANSLRTSYEGHRLQHVLGDDDVVTGVHGTDDTVNFVTTALAFDLPTAVALLNDLRAKFTAHITDVAFVPPVHKFPDAPNIPVADPATSLASAAILANDLRRRYESHRQDRFVHVVDDPVNRVTVKPVKPVVGTYPGPLTGPFVWTLKDPRYGTVADDPTDVSVVVNSLGATVDAVFGLLGAVVLASKPAGPDTVSIDYDYMSNPPARLLRTNSSEFNTNQAGNRGYAGLPSHRYRSRSHIIDPGHSPDLMSAVSPKRIGWKYKAFERAYSALTNDPTTLLTNVPANKTAYPVLFESVPEITIRYDPFVLPQNSPDKWTLAGEGTLTLAPGGNALTIVDNDVQTGPDSNPPFFYHFLDLKSPSQVSAAFRVLALDDSSLTLDGVFTGVSFGVSDGQRVTIVGLLLSEASNLSSAIVLANDLKAKFDSHLTNLGSHSPDDTSDAIPFVDATNLLSLKILANEIRARYSSHIAKGSGVGLVHKAADGINVVLSPAATDLPSAIVLLNELRIRFNAHALQAGVHFVDDATNSVGLVRQAGILTNRGFPEFIASWNSFAADWTEFKTYRIARDPDGSAGVFLSGDTEAQASAELLDLPALSDIDGRFDPAQQVFFGPIWRDSTNTSVWQFVRVNSTPVDANLIGDNKFVDYVPNVVPELDPAAPWITIGQGGSERVILGPTLLLDSSASAFADEIPALGQTSGAYRGFLRLEPILSTGTAAVLEFQAAIDYYTFGLDNKAAAVVLDDGEFTVQLCFLQFSPSAPTVTGTTTEPYPMVNGDSFRFNFGGGSELVVTFSATDTTAALVATAINIVAGYAFADVVSGKVRLTSNELGSAASFTVVSGSSLAKLGISPGTYIGKDSNPEPRISWFGANFPDLDTPSWTRGGLQASAMLGRTMRLTDASISDYVAFTESDPLITNLPINSVSDWKMSFRCRVLSCAPGGPVPATIPKLSLSPCGVIVSVDEGTSGKNLELHLAVDGSNNQYLNLLSFNQGSGALDVVAQYAFNWNDGGFHSFDVFTSKGTNLVFVLADGSFLSPILGPIPNYTALNQGSVSGPSISFGSGGEPVAGADLRTSRSVVDWTSVNIFRDSKVGDPTAASRRYVGLYRGGDPSLLSSYLLTQVDWTVFNTYRIIRNPVTSVSVYLNGSPIPSISDAFDVLSLPSSGASFLKGITNGNSCVAFGSFSSTEVSRIRWGELAYSIGRITTSDRIVPPHNLTNRSNAVASPDHLRTQLPHFHNGFSTYSGGTPQDSFLADPELKAYTTLGEGTPPVPMTQNLESRKGLVKVGTSLNTVPVSDAVNVRGEMTDLYNDPDDSVVQPQSSAAFLFFIQQSANDLKSAFNIHRTVTNGFFVSGHVLDDLVNTVVSPTAVDLPTTIVLLNEIKAKFNAHTLSGVFHTAPDPGDVVTAPDASDLESSAVLINAIMVGYQNHKFAVSFHNPDDPANVVVDPDATDLVSAALLAQSMMSVLNSHFLRTVSQTHLAEDLFNLMTGNSVSGVGFSTVVTGNVLTPDIPLSVGEVVRFLEGPNIGVDRTVFLALGSGQFAVTPIFPSNTGSLRFAKVVGGNPSIDPGSVVDQANLMKARFNAHRTQVSSDAPPQEPPGLEFLDDHRIHMTSDLLDAVTLPDAVTIEDAILLLNDVKAKYGAHRVGTSFHLVRGVGDTPGTTVNVPPLENCLASLNPLRERFLNHLSASRIHLANDTENGELPGEATDLSSAIELANAIRGAYEAHRTATINEVQKVHVKDDTVNAIPAPLATDMESLLDLVADEVAYFNLHLVESGVHGATIYIRLDPPSRVLYSGMKFFKFEGGEEGHVYPFSDDETLHIDGAISFTRGQSLSYDGSVMPEDVRVQEIVLLANNLKAKYNSHRTQLGVHVLNDAVNAVLTPGAIDLPSAIALLIDIKAKFNAHLLQLGVHVANDILDKILVMDPVDAPTATSLANEIRMKFELHRLSTAYHLVPDNANAVTVQSVSPVENRGWRRTDDGFSYQSFQVIGPDSFLRYGVFGSTSSYAIKTGIPDTPSLGFTMTIRMRINAFTYSPDVDTGIYAGFLGAFGPGVAAAVGFDALNNIPYVKIQDVNADKPLYRIPFNWADGNFHTFRIVKDPGNGNIGIVVLE